jgi:outer membrane receptor for ferrienterochelin and colicins
MKRAVLSCVLVGWASSAYAQSDVDDLEGLLNLNVVSSASRAEERSEDAPATVTVVTADDLRRYGLRSLHEAINFLSLGVVAQDPLHAVEVGSRGVLLTADYGNHLLLVIDGHVMNDQWNNTAYFEQGLGIPLEFIDHVELIVGPGSVLYGSSAMLGVINIVTKRPRDLGRIALTAEGSLVPPQGVDGAPQLRWPGFGGTARASVLAGYETVLAGRALGVSFAGEYYAHRGQSLTFAVQDGLTDTDGERTWPQRWGPRAPAPGSWGGTTTDAWWTQVPSGLLKVSWGDFAVWARVALYGRGTPAMDQLGVAADFDSEAKEVDRWVNLELRWARMLSPRLRLMVRATLDLYDYLASTQASSWTTYGSSDGPEGVDLADFTFLQVERGGSRSGDFETQATWDWLGDGRFPLMLGAVARLRRFHDGTTYSTTDGVPFETSNTYDVDEWQVAVYVQQRARLLSTLQLNVGARLDLQSVFLPRLSPRAALVWTAPWGARVKAVINSAFRSPSGFERFAQYPPFQVRNPGLQPEGVLTGELGYEQRVGRHRVMVVGFVSHFSDMVRYLPAFGDASSGVSWYENQGSLLNVGGHALVEGSFGKLSYAATFTGAVNQSDQPLVASPGWFGNARVSWQGALARLSLASTFSGERLISAAATTGLDADGNELSWDEARRSVGPQLELRATIDGNVPAVPNLWLRAVVGGSVTPFSAYVAGPQQAPSPGATTPALLPNSRLFVMVTAGWSLDAP